MYLSGGTEKDAQVIDVVDERRCSNAKTAQQERQCGGSKLCRGGTDLAASTQHHRWEECKERCVHVAMLLAFRQKMRPDARRNRDATETPTSFSIITAAVSLQQKEGGGALFGCLPLDQHSADAKVVVDSEAHRLRCSARKILSISGSDC